MVIAPFANAAMVDTFASGASEVEIVVKDSQGFINDVDASTSLMNP